MRTAWLFGPPGGDFPDKITAAADRLAEAPLAVVADEYGSPTYTLDLARAIHALVARTRGGTYHLVNRGIASRYDWARAVLALRRPGRELKPISQADFERPSRPPRWGVLDTSRAAATGVTLRPMARRHSPSTWHTRRRERMKVTVQRTSIPEVLVVEHEIFTDERGFFMEAFHADHFAAFADLGLPSSFVQLNHSRSTAA